MKNELAAAMLGCPDEVPHAVLLTVMEQVRVFVTACVKMRA